MGRTICLNDTDSKISQRLLFMHFHLTNFLLKKFESPCPSSPESYQLSDNILLQYTLFYHSSIVAVACTFMLYEIHAITKGDLPVSIAIILCSKLLHQLREIYVDLHCFKKIFGTIRKNLGKLSINFTSQ